MRDSKPRQPKGPTEYDLLGMNDEDFESMVARLVRLEFPEAFKPANTSDGGADTVLRAEGGDAYRRCWQAKHYPSNIRWAKCEKSLADARANWPGMREYTFVFPRDLTVGEQKTFDQKFRSGIGIDVNHWGGTELQARLAGSDGGQRVAKTFFDVNLDREVLERLAAAGGPLETHEDALRRLGTIGGFLAGSDAYFQYPATTHEEGQPGPGLTPGTVMSIGQVVESIERRIDVVPRDEESLSRYGPEFVLDASAGEEGQAAAAKLEEALSEGKAAEIGEGLDLTFTRLPPALQDLVGKRLTGGQVKVGPAQKIRPRAEPFMARLAADTDRGRAHIDIELHQLDEVPEGWDDAFAGAYGPMVVSEVARAVGAGGEVRWSFRYRRDESRVQLQLDALRFLHAVGGAGVIEFSRLGADGEPLRSPTEPTPAKPEHQALIAFLEDVRTIEEWAEVEYELPQEIDAAEATRIRQMATIIRDGGVKASWNRIELVVSETGAERLREGGVLRIEHADELRALGKTVSIGYTTLDIGNYEIDSVERSSEDADQYVVRVQPPGGNDADVFAALRKERTQAAGASASPDPKTRHSSKPPPPPPRKRRRRGRKKRRR